MSAPLSPIMMYTEDLCTHERTPIPVSKQYTCDRATGTRKQGSSLGVIVTTGRTNSQYRQEIADAMTLVTETAIIGVPAGSGIYRTYPVRFEVTHRIIHC